MAMLIGRRMKPGDDGYYVFADFRPGDYFILADGKWSGVTPNGHHCGLANHQVTEHDDGTITVEPSIIVWGRDHQELWHGYLKAGVWRQV